MRPPIDEQSMILGRGAEQRVAQFLGTRGIPFVWNNEDHESFGVDFTILYPFVIQAEVEHKSVRFLSLALNAGIDFLAAKVNGYPNDTIYILEMETGFFFASMGYIKTHGEIINKETFRMKCETFYRVAADKLVWVSYN